MPGSHLSNPVMIKAAAVLAVAALIYVAPAHAAELAGPPAFGQPTVLFPPSPPPRTLSSAPAKRPVAAVQKIPLDGKPLIPPAAKLSPPPDPRPALSLETDLQPVAPTAPASPAPSASGAPAPAAKPSS